MGRQRFAFAWAAILGYDIFISYRRSDGSAYAEKLARDLKAAGLTPFLDRDETPGGAQLTPSLMRALRRSRMLVVVLTPDVLNSEWVQQEVEVFANFKGRAIAPVNIDDYLGRHNLDGTRLSRLKDYSWIEETREGLVTGVPSETVLTEIAKGFRKVRVRSISRLITAAVMVTLAVAALIAFVQMRRAQREAEVAFAAQVAAEAELMRTQDHSQLDLAAALAFDSMRRNPSAQAEQTLRAALESLPVELASFEADAEARIAFTPDGNGILTTSRDGGKASLSPLPANAPRELFTCEASQVCQIEVAAGLAARAVEQPGGSTLRVVDLLTGAERAVFDWDSVPAALVVNETGRVLAGVTAAGKACLWRVGEPGLPVCIDGPANARWKFNAAGNLLLSHLSGDDDREDRRVWNTETGGEVEHTGGWLVMSRTGKYTAVTTGNTYVRVHDLEGGSTLPDLQHEDTVGGVAFHETDRVMATSSTSYWLRLWAFEVERPQAPVAAAVADTHRSLIGFTTGHSSHGLGIVTLANNPRGGADVLIWRVRRRDRKTDLVPKQRLRHQFEVRAVAQHPDGDKYATLDDKGVIRVWDTRDGNLVSFERRPQAPEPPSQVCRGGASWMQRLAGLRVRAEAPAGAPDPKNADANDPCGGYFASRTKRASMGRDPETITIYKTATREEVARIEHRMNVNSVSFSDDGRYVVTGGEDHDVRIWDLEKRRPVSAFEVGTEVKSARFSADGRRIVVVGEDDGFGGIPVATYLWKTEDLLAAMLSRQVRPMSPAEWGRFLGAGGAGLPAAFLAR